MIKNKKILIVTTQDDFVARFLLPHIKHLEDNGNTVECACNHSGFWFDEMKEQGIKLHEMCFTRFPFTLKNLKAKKRLFKLAKKEKYDLVICHQPVGGIMGRLVAKKYKVPVIYIAHGFHFYKGCPKKNLLYKAIEKWASKRTDILVTMNQEDYLASLKFKAKMNAKIHGIGVDLNKYSRVEDVSQTKAELGINDGDFVLLSVGELNKNKNHELVIRAMEAFKGKPVKYFICGEGPRHAEYDELVKKLGLEGQVKLLGYRKDIPAIISSSNVFVMPSMREGLPKSIMEAMVAGLPIVASNIRGCRDLVEENKGGLLFDPRDKKSVEDAITTLINCPEKATEFGTYNQEKIKEYSIENVLTEMENIYDKI